MPYNVRLSPEETPLNQITQDLAGRGFLFWRKFTVTLTNKRLHAYEKFIVSHSQKTFDLRDLDSIFQEKKFYGGYSFLLGFLGFVPLMVIGTIFSIMVENVMTIFVILGSAIWIAIFILFFFRRLLVVRSRNDQISIDVIRMPEELLGDFVQSVLHQKEQSLGATPSTSNTPTSSSSAADKIKQLSELRAQGLITEQEFDAKKKEILRNM